MGDTNHRRKNSSKEEYNSRRIDKSFDRATRRSKTRSDRERRHIEESEDEDSE